MYQRKVSLSHEIESSSFLILDMVDYCSVFGRTDNSHSKIFSHFGDLSRKMWSKGIQLQEVIYIRRRGREEHHVLM